MWNELPKLDKYEYVRTSPYVIRVIGLLGTLSVVLMAYGYINFLELNIYYYFIFGPVIFIVIFNKLLRFFIQIFYPKFDIKKHEKFVSEFWENNSEPAVDVFLPYAGEDLTIHEEVVKAATELNYKNYNVYLLDDSPNESQKYLAEKYNCTYISRPNKGEWKKSGNLEFGYGKSNGEFIFILDADFKPSKDALKDTIPYIASDSRIGILQTPQYFDQSHEVHQRSKIEFGGGNIVEDFYRISMPCRDEFNAAMCVGTSAIYRRTAVIKLNGTPKVHASEDLATGLLITKIDYNVKYIPLIISIGMSPNTFQGYFIQHQRWCSGNLIFAEYWPKAKLNLVARIIYLLNPTYYLAEAFSILFTFQFLILLYLNSPNITLYQIYYFIPFLIVDKLIIPIFKVNKDKPGTKLAALSNSYTYLYTFLSLLIKKFPQWHPSGTKLNTLHKDFLSCNKMGITISTVFLLSFSYLLISHPLILGNFNLYPILFWAVYSAFWHTVYLTTVGSSILSEYQYLIDNFRTKVNFYYRAGISPLLLSFTLGIFLANSYDSIKKPDTPTAVVLSNLVDKKNINILSEVFKTNIKSNKILAASGENNLKQIYFYEISENLTIQNIAYKAISDYLDRNNLFITNGQMNFAVNKLAPVLQAQNNKKVEIKGEVIEKIIDNTIASNI